MKFSPQKFPKPMSGDIECYDPGHMYGVKPLCQPRQTLPTVQIVHFVKRSGDNYPGNRGTQDGPITQSFLRVMIHRCKYMNAQGPCAETDIIISSLRTALMAFEVRAARCRGVKIELSTLDGIEDILTCPTCGHIFCDQKRHEPGVPHWSEEK